MHPKKKKDWEEAADKSAFIYLFRPELFLGSDQELQVSHAGHEASADMPKPVGSQAPVRHPCSLHLSTGLARKPNAFPVRYTFCVSFSATTYGPNSMRIFTRDSTLLQNPTHEQCCSLHPTSTFYLLFVVLPVHGRKAMFSQ